VDSVPVDVVPSPSPVAAAPARKIKVSKVVPGRNVAGKALQKAGVAAPSPRRGSAAARPATPPAARSAPLGSAERTLQLVRRSLTLPRGRRAVAVRRRWRTSVRRHLERVPAEQAHDHALVLARSERLRVFGVEFWLLMMGLAVPLLAFVVAVVVRPHLAGAVLIVSLIVSVTLFGEHQMERDVELAAARDRVLEQARS